MNYQKIYDQIIHRAISEKRKKLNKDNDNYVYYENHHIIPKCLGGSDLKENLVLLKAKEHFVCHKLLAGIYPKDKKLFYALLLMSTIKSENRNYKISAKEYEQLKLICSIYVSGENNPMFGKTGELHPSFGKEGRKHTEEEKLNQSMLMSKELNPMWNKTHTEKVKSILRESCKKRKGIKLNLSKEELLRRSEMMKERNKIFPLFGENNPFWGKTHSPEVLEKLKCKNVNKQWTEERKIEYGIKISGKGNHNFQKKMSEEQKIKISETKRKAEEIACIHCGFLSKNKAMISRWHNENCKHKNNL